MKTDAEVLLMTKERGKGKTQEQAAARAGMSVRTVRTYEQAGRLPSELKAPRAYRTRTDPFAEDWPWVVEHLRRMELEWPAATFDVEAEKVRLAAT